MPFYTVKPTTIIPTNSSFILDEMYDMRVTQIGGTEDFSTSGEDPQASVYTYLYIKCMDEAGQIKYAKVTISPFEKIIIDDALSSSEADADGNLQYKNIGCQIRRCSLAIPYVNPWFGMNKPSEFEDIPALELYLFWEKDKGITQYPDAFAIKEYFKFVEFVDQPQPHAMYFSNKV